MRGAGEVGVDVKWRITLAVILDHLSLAVAPRGCDSGISEIELLRSMEREQALFTVLIKLAIFSIFTIVFVHARISESR